MVKIQLKFNAAVIKEFPFSKNEMTIGRKSDNDIVIDNPAVSGHHARIIKQGDDFLLEDLNSTNGTFLRDRKILKTAVRDKDEIGIAKHVVVFLNDQEKSGTTASVEAVSSDATVVISPASSSRPPESASASSSSASSGVGALRVVEGDASSPVFSLVGLTTYIGKSDQAQVRLKGFFAPDMAACIARKPEGYFLKVLKEKSVKINGALVADQSALSVGDKIEVGNLTLMFFQQDANAPMVG
jgi:pSer/pThr/pTyr-binding forkhead associated (FHA) protein